tara:strand:+ start:5416 stop:5955 length:540 start_codon:yes stop_codon:yes gene_type:complete
MIRFLIFFFACAIANGQMLIDIYKVDESGASPIYTLANAANPTETNATTGFTNEINVSHSSVTSSPTPQDGTYCILQTNTGADNTSSRGATSFATDGSSTYEVKVYLQEVIGTNWTVSLFAADGWAVSDTQNVTAVGTWVEYTLTAVSNDTTGSIRFSGSSSSDNGNQIAIDNIRVTKL